MLDGETSQTNTEDGTNPDNVFTQEGDNSQGNQTEGEAESQKMRDTFYPGDEKKADQKQEAESKEPADDKKEAGEKKSWEQDSNQKGQKEDDGEPLELALPKETKLSQDDMERIESYAKEQGLSKEAAQKLVESESEARDAYFDQLQSEHKEIVQGWFDQTRQDKELGGENFRENAELCRRVLDRFGTEELRKDLETSGYGNHPEVVRVFARIGKAMDNDVLVRGGKHSGGEKSMEDLFYGNKQE